MAHINRLEIFYGLAHLDQAMGIPAKLVACGALALILHDSLSTLHASILSLSSAVSVST